MASDLIDLHAHILPGLDDGPATMVEALELVKQAERIGVGTIVASPHAFDGVHENTREKVLEATAALTRALTDAGSRVRVLPGMELYLGPDLPEALRVGTAMGLNDSKNVLVELPGIAVQRYVDTLLFQLTLAGYIPVINHPERSPLVQRSLQVYENWVHIGCLGLVTAPSLLGLFGPSTQRTAELLLRRGLAHGVASDVHRLSGTTGGPGARGRSYSPEVVAALSRGQASQREYLHSIAG